MFTSISSPEISELLECSSINEFSNHLPNNKQKLNIVHINIRSIVKNFSLVLQFIDSSKINIDVIILTEVGISKNSNLIQFFNIIGYEMYHKLREQRRGGGIVMYVKCTNNFQIMDNVTLNHCEYIIGHLTTSYHYTTSICAVYRPPNNSKHLFIRELKELLCKDTFKHSDLYLLGDVNIDLKLKDNIRDYYISCLAECGLTSAISDYTRIEKRNDIITRSCIDHIFVRSRSLDLYSAALGAVWADHRMIVLSCIGGGAQSVVQDVVKVKELFDYNKLKQKIGAIDWNLVDSMQCPLEIYSYIKNSFDYCYEQSKYSKIINTNSKRNKELWINSKINNMCRKRDLLFTQWKQDINNKTLRLQYNKQRNKTKKVIDKSRNQYYFNLINENKMNKKKMWEILNTLSGRICKSVDEAIIKAFKKNNLTINTIANNFSKGFSENVNKILPKCDIKLIPESEYMPPINKSMLFKNPTVRNVSTIIKNLNVNKSAGADGIRCVDVKVVSDKISKAIAKLIKTSIQVGEYPQELKSGIVRPVYKNGSHSNYENYRPVTILPVIDKVVEKYVCQQIQNFYIENDVISGSQYGFQPNKSTSILLSKFTDEINHHLNDKKHVILLFIDFSKAFDTLRHDTLINKLDNAGVRGPILNWCKDYLRNRTCRVKISNEHSDVAVVTTGTAQGSVLGPLHYLTYVNDMENFIKNCSVYQYADDTCLVAADKDLSKAEQSIQNDFDNLCKWSHDAGLVINAGKTKTIHVRSNHLLNSNEPVTIVAHDHQCLHKSDKVRLSSLGCKCEPLEQVTNYKYLGLIVDDRFNWGNHIDSICDKLRAMLAKFAIIKYKVPFKILLNLYNALAESIISYGITSYGRTFKTYIDKIYNLQLRLLKIIIPNNVRKKLYDGDDVTGFFKYCKILPVHTKMRKLLLIEQFTNKNLQVKFNHRIATRLAAQSKLVVPSFKNYYGKRTVAYLIPTLINDVPTKIQSEITNSNYKYKYRQFFNSL